MRNTSNKTPGHAGANSGDRPDDPTGLRSLKPPRGYTGRKPLADGSARTSVLAIKISDQDRHRIEQRALKAGLPVATYIREAALKARVTGGRSQAAPSLAEMAQIAQLNEVALAITREANRLSRPSTLPQPVLDAYARISRLTEVLMGQAELRDRAGVQQQQIATELAHIGRNLNQITRAVNGMAQRRDGDTTLPPETGKVLRDITQMLDRLGPISQPPIDHSDAAA